jgi:hypothetical protein
MSSSSQILWTTLPVTIDSSGNGYVSVLVSPKLDGSVQSLSFPFQDWPTRMQNAKFQVLLYDMNNPNPWQTHAATVMNATFDLPLWQAIFPSSGMAMKPYPFATDNTDRQLWSYSVDAVHENIKQVYASVAASSPTALPKIDWNHPNTPLMKLIEQYADANAQRTQTRQALGNNWTGKWDQRNAEEIQAMQGAFRPLTALQRQVWLGKRFYDRPTPNKDQHNNLMGVGQPLVPITFDFNERIALLSDHPYLMRRLGLLIDLQFPWNGTQLGYVKVTPSGDYQNAGYTDVCPRTAYASAGTSFHARVDTTPSAPSDSTDVIDRMIPLEDPVKFYVTTGDPDGTMHKTVDFSSNMVSLISFLQNEASASGTQATPPSEGLPARRNNGITVTRKGRAAALTSRFQRIKTLNTDVSASQGQAPADLYAADLLHGYRVDVRAGGATGAWASLHQRMVTYVVNGALLSPPAIAANTDSRQPPLDPFGMAAWQGPGTILDEGYMKVASGTSDPDKVNGPKDLYVHEKIFGWHGWSLSASRPGKTIQPDSSTGAPDHTPKDPTMPVTPVVRVAPGTLPSLRYGQSYELRARAVDLAGNSFTLGDATIPAFHKTPPVTFGRVEPVPPPALVYANGVSEGESLETLVIRSNPADGVDSIQMAAFLHNAYLNDPTNALQFTDLGNPHKDYYSYCDRHVAPPKETQTTAEWHGDFDPVFAAGASLDKWYRYGTREEGTFMDTQIVMVLDPGGYTGNLNNPIIVRPPSVPADQPPQSPVLGSGTVMSQRGAPLASGEYIICQPASGFVATPYLPDSMAGGFVVWDPANPTVNTWKWSWGAPGNDFSAWPDYPCTRIRLVESPTFQTGTFAENGGTLLGIGLPPATILTLNYASTPRPDRLNHLEYVQEYNPQDDITDGRHWMVTPSRSVTFIHAVQKPLAPPVGSISQTRGLGDTFVLHRGSMTTHSHSTGQVDLRGDWTEFLDDIALPGPTQTPTTGRAYQLAIPYGQDKTAIAGLKHEFHDTKHRIVKYTPTGTTRYKVFFPPGIINDPTKISVDGTAPNPAPGSNGNYNILSSARPVAPKVAYIVPTFGWSQPNAQQSIRSSNSLRIYIERPWFSSGEGELLAAVVSKSGTPAPGVQPFVSTWGPDPIWDSKSNGPLTAAAFKNPSMGVRDCVLAENGAVAQILPLAEPKYSDEKKLWYVDVELAAGQRYFPFVSLALVRYQKDSLAGVEISQVTRADMAQLVPDRTLNVAWELGGNVLVTVTGVAADNVVGHNWPASPPPHLPAGYVPAPHSHYLVARIQQQIPGAYGTVGWVDVTSDVQLVGMTPIAGGNTKWQGTVNPNGGATPPTPGAPLRIIVEEFEMHYVDPEGGSIPLFPPTAQRLVYVDTIGVPTGIIVRPPPPVLP